jgi:hypothetical protein
VGLTNIPDILHPEASDKQMRGAYNKLICLDIWYNKCAGFKYTPTQALCRDTYKATLRIM